MFSPSYLLFLVSAFVNYLFATVLQFPHIFVCIFFCAKYFHIVCSNGFKIYIKFMVFTESASRLRLLVKEHISKTAKPRNAFYERF